jgi:hypothetical protein
VGACACCFLLAGAGGEARAQEVEGEAGFSHRRQVSLHLQGGVGYRGIFPYDEEFCGELEDDGTTKSPCLGRSPFSMDIGLAYGLTRRLEILVEGRLGVERDIGEDLDDDEGPHAVSLAPGIKGYFAEIGSMMLFATLQVAVDFTGYGQIDETDIGVRNVDGLHYDLNDNFGLFLFVGNQVGFVRWLRFEVEAGLGVQLRVP